MFGDHTVEAFSSCGRTRILYAVDFIPVMDPDIVFQETKCLSCLFGNAIDMVGPFEVF